MTTATASTRRVRVISADEVARHAREDDCWLIHDGKVYDVSDFVPDHPGGEDLVMRYAGKDLGDIMNDPSEHDHSDSAFDLLEEHLIGRLPVSDDERVAAEEGTEQGKEIIITDDFVPEDSDPTSDFAKTRFLDLNRPLVLQVLRANFGKKFYLEQVHQPRHLKEPARFFEPFYLEMFTRTPWYVVPMVWAPITAALFLRSVQQFARGGVDAGDFWSFVQDGHMDLTMLGTGPAAKTATCFLLGNVIWTILEYGMHRFLFHVDGFLPDKPFFLMLHFLLHGVHHYLPMDRLRLVMPPILFAALSYPFTRLAYLLFPVAIANGIIAGSFGMYIVYDLGHYALHHTRLPEYLRKQKKYHLEHHYKNPDLGFGVTSPIWDWVFGTTL